MEKLVVDEEGKVAIPPHILESRALHPGDELTLVEADEGLLLYQPGADPLIARWWASLDEEGRRQTRVEAERYEELSEVKRDKLWEVSAELSGEH